MDHRKIIGHPFAQALAAGLLSATIYDFLLDDVLESMRGVALTTAVLSGTLVSQAIFYVQRRSQRRNFSPALLRARRELDNVSSTIVNQLPDRLHPLGRILEGWYSTVSAELEKGGARTILVDSDYYRACLSRLRGVEGVRAVADLSVDVENFWETGIEPEAAAVSERVFLLPWLSLFDDARMGSSARCFLATPLAILYE